MPQILMTDEKEGGMIHSDGAVRSLNGKHHRRAKYYAQRNTERDLVPESWLH